MIVTGNDIVDWAHKNIPNNLGFENPIGYGIIRNDQLVGAVVYDNWRPAVKSICVSIVIKNKHALSKKILNILFSEAFIRLDCLRMSALIESDNQSSVKLCRSLGFIHEGTLRKASFVQKDLLVFGMLRSECKWLSDIKKYSTG